MIKISDLTKKYRNKKGIFNINIDFPNTGLVIINGISGSGKSTLLNSIIEEKNIKEKKVLIQTSNIKGHNLMKKQLSYLAVDDNLLEKYTIYQNISLVYELMNEKIDKNEVIKLFESHNMSNLLNKYPNELSLGEKKICSLYISLCKDSSIYLLDEITANLDKENSNHIINILKELSKSKLIVIASHSKEILIKADEIITINKGQIDEHKIISKSNNKNLIENSKFKIKLGTYIKHYIYSLKSEWLKNFISIGLLSIVVSLFGVINEFKGYDYIDKISTILIENDISFIELFKYKKIQLDVGPVTNIVNIENEDLTMFNNYYLSYKITNNYITQIYELDTKENITLYNQDYVVTGEELNNLNDVYITDYMAERLLDNLSIGQTFLFNEHELMIKGIIETNYKNLSYYQIGTTSSLTTIYTKSGFYDKYVDFNASFLGSLNLINDTDLGEYKIVLNDNLNNNELIFDKRYEEKSIELIFSSVSDHLMYLVEAINFNLIDAVSDTNTLEVSKTMFTYIKTKLIGQIKTVVVIPAKTKEQLYDQIKTYEEYDFFVDYNNTGINLIIFDDLVIILNKLFDIIICLNLFISSLLLINLSFEKRNKDDFRLLKMGFSRLNLCIYYFIKCMIMALVTYILSIGISYSLINYLNNLVFLDRNIMSIDLLYILNKTLIIYVIYFTFILIKSNLSIKNVKF